MTALRLALFGERFEAVAARRDQRELRSDEERVRGEQQNGEQHARRCRPSASSSRSRVAAAAQFGQLEQVDAPAVHPHDRGQPAHRVVERAVGVECGELHRLAGLGNVAQAPAAPDRRWSRIRLPERGIRCSRPPRRCAAAPTPASCRGSSAPRRGSTSSCSSRTSPTISSIRSSIGHHARGAAVLVDDQRGLQAVGPDLRHHVVAVEASTAPPAPAAPGRPAGMRPLVGRHLEDLFDVHDADRLVEVAVDDREARVAGLRSRRRSGRRRCRRTAAPRSWTAGSSAPRRCARRTAATGPPAAAVIGSSAPLRARSCAPATPVPAGSAPSAVPRRVRCRAGAGSSWRCRWSA